MARLELQMRETACEFIIVLCKNNHSFNYLLSNVQHVFSSDLPTLLLLLVSGVDHGVDDHRGKVGAADRSYIGFSTFF